MLALQIAVILVLRTAWYTLDWITLAWVALAAQAIRAPLAALLRAPMLAAGARALDRPGRGLLRAPQLFAVELFIVFAQVLAASLIAVPIGGASLLVLWRGLELFGAIGISVACVGAALVALLVRASLVYALPEVIVVGRSPWAAIAEGWRRGRGDRVQLAAILLLGDVLLALGGALCVAGALPGYPMRDLAVLHRWVARTEERA